MSDPPEEIKQSQDVEPEDSDKDYPKADVIHRFTAKFIDLLIAGGLAQFIFPVGFMAGLTYLLIADGFSGGRSFGKRLIRLQAMVYKNHSPVTIRESILRNIPCAAAFLCFLIPFIGWILGLGLFIFEGLLIIGNRDGVRLGDEIAQTRVIEGIASPSEPEETKGGQPIRT